jgi:hypothetical protein
MLPKSQGISVAEMMAIKPLKIFQISSIRHNESGSTMRFENGLYKRH